MSKYHVALSFAGEDRPYIESVATCLKAEGVNVFYDLFEEVDLWGKNLYDHLSDVYQNQASFTVMFVSNAYRNKLWTNHERQSAQARAFSENQEYILPAFFDEDIEVPGLSRTTGYISLKAKTPGDCAALIVEKLTRSGIYLPHRFSYAEHATADVDFPLPQGSLVSTLISKMKSYTWGVQNPAVDQVLALEWGAISADEAFVLGRNLYQCADGESRSAGGLLDNLRRKLAKLPEERALDLLNGMFYETYFNSSGHFRGDKLKDRCLEKLLALQDVKKYAPSVAFIRRELEPYRSRLLFAPNTEPESVQVSLSVSNTEPLTILELTMNGGSLLEETSDEGSFSPLWGLTQQRTFTLEALRMKLAGAWHIPLGQLQLRCASDLGEKRTVQLPDEICIKEPDLK